MLRALPVPAVFGVLALVGVLTLAGAIVSPAAAYPLTPELLWQFQGIEDIVAMDTLPDVDGDGVADVLVETYDAGADGDHIYLLSGGDTSPPTVIWSDRPESGASNGGGWGDECLATCPDISGDGFPDVLLGTAWGNRSVHAFDGQDGTVLWTFDTYNETDSGWVYCVRPHPDRTGDGKPEVIFGAGSENDRGYMLDGADGTPLWRFLQSVDAVGYALSMTDVNGDEVADVLFCGWDNEDRVFCVSGDGIGVPAPIWDTDNGASNHGATLIDDVDGDEIADVVVGTWGQSDQVRCLSGVDGGLVWDFHNGNYEYIMRLVTIDDVNDDGYRDVAVGSWARAVRVVSGLDGTLIWESWAGTLNGGDFWSVDRVDDITGDGLSEVVGGSFDTNVYLFDGADGDTLWTYYTGKRLKSVRGTADLSGNSVVDVLGGEQYLSSGGKVHALEGGDTAVPVPDLPQVAGRAGWLGDDGEGGAPGERGVELRWSCEQSAAFRVYRIVGESAKDAAATKAELTAAFARGELTTREVIDRRLAGAKSAPATVLLTPEPLLPETQRDGAWHYRLVDTAVPAGEVRYRLTVQDESGGEVILLELAPAGRAVPEPLFHAAAVAPNPFNPLTVVRFDLDRAADVTLAVYDVAGRRVHVRGPERFAAGAGSLRWDGRDQAGRELPAGLYLMRLEAPGESRVLRAVLVR